MFMRNFGGTAKSITVFKKKNAENTASLTKRTRFNYFLNQTNRKPILTVEPLNFPLLVYNTIACSQTLRFLFRDRRAGARLKRKTAGTYWPLTQGDVLPLLRARSHAHASLARSLNSSKKREKKIVDRLSILLSRKNLSLGTVLRNILKDTKHHPISICWSWITGSIAFLSMLTRMDSP